jgi:hypothetical protein
MNNKDFKRHMAYEALVVLGVLALLLFICRLWPILLLVILGVFIAALRLLFLSARKVEIIEPLPHPVHDPTEQDVRDMAYGSINRRVTELVTAVYADARWVWKTPNARANIAEGNEVRILLNKAGGYREAIVVIRNLQACGLAFLSTQDTNPDVPESDEPESVNVGSDESPKPQPVNYEFIAFEWVDAHAMELNERCNEAIAQGAYVLTIGAAELPTAESWPDICRELELGGMEDCRCTDAGIRINLTQ